jgi:hypothetical protein
MFELLRLCVGCPDNSDFHGCLRPSHYPFNSSTCSLNGPMLPDDPPRVEAYHLSGCLVGWSVVRAVADFKS